MKRYSTPLLLLLCFLFLFSNCAADKKELPNTPEKVARQWQEWIDNNQFQLARELSTGNAIEWINWAEETLRETSEDSEVLSPAIFLSMTCEEFGNKAICGFVMDDEGYEYRDSFYLEKVNGQWFVDILEADLKEEDSLKELFEEMEKAEQ